MRSPAPRERSAPRVRTARSRARCRPHADRPARSGPAGSSAPRLPCRKPSRTAAARSLFLLPALFAVLLGALPGARLADALERILDRAAQSLDHLDAGVVLVVRLDQGPRREGGRGTVDHVADRGLVLLPLLAVAPVFVGDLEALEGDFLAQLEAPELLLLADRQP